MLEMTATQSFQLFEKALVGNNYSQNSIRAYRDDVKQFIEWLKKQRVDWDNSLRFNKIDIVEFLSFLAAQNTTGVTRVRKLASLRKFFRCLKDNNIISNSPTETVIGPMREERDPEVLYRNEYKALLFEASGNPRDYAILQVFLQTGIRIGELVKLTINDIDLENRILVVRQGKGKRDRGIPLEEQAISAIRAYLPKREGLKGANIIDEETLFLAKNGSSLDVRTVRYFVHKYMEKAGIKKQASVHTLRHTFGTHKIDKGMTIPALQELLGHKQIETTFKYVHLAKTNLREQQEQTAL